MIDGFREEAPMKRDQFWLTDAQFLKIAPHFPTNTRGNQRVDNPRVINGMVHVLKSGGRWINVPPKHGPKKTLHNRYVCGAIKGVWTGPFQALVQAGGPPADVLIDPSAVKARRDTRRPKRRKFSCRRLYRSPLPATGYESGPSITVTI